MAVSLSRPATTPAGTPAVAGLPMLGNMLEFRYGRLPFLQRVARSSGDIGAFHVGPYPIYLVNSPDLADDLLVKQAESFEKTPTLRVFGRPVLGNGLLTSENNFHRRQRKLVAPALAHRRIAAYADTMALYGERIAQDWSDGAQIDVAHEMMRLTLHIVGKTLFDADVLGEADELGSALTTAIGFMNDEMGSIVHLPTTWPLPRNKRFHAAVARLDATIYRIIADRRTDGTDHGDLLSMLLASRDEDDGAAMDDQQVRDEAMTLFLAGHETTANALAWAWYLLSQHPAVAVRLREEADRVLAGRTPTYDDLAQLPYALQVFKEAMRLYPPAYMIGRQASRPVELGGYHFAPHAILMVSAYVMHRTPQYFADPERFDPERFTPEAERALPRHAYMPFGGGPRVCIGNHFALMEGQILLATLAQRVSFDLLLGQRIEMDPQVTLRPKNGIQMAVRRRVA